MKKTSLILLALLLVLSLSGCAAKNAQPENTNTLEVSQPQETNSPLARTISENKSTNEGNRDLFTPVTLTGTEVSFSDFDFLEEWMYAGFPEDVYYPYASYLPGTWKYRIYYLNDNATDGYVFNEIGLADIDIDFDNAVFYLDLHPHYENYNEEIYDVRNLESGYSTFAGTFEGDGIKLVDEEGELIDYIYSYFAYEGREYIYSTLYMSEEDYCMLVFTRGQN